MKKEYLNIDLSLKKELNLFVIDMMSFPSFKNTFIPSREARYTKRLLILKKINLL